MRSVRLRDTPRPGSITREGTNIITNTGRIIFPDTGKESHVIVPTRMPTRYLVEMYVDRVAASAIYNKGHYTEDMPLKYFKKGDYTHLMEEHTRRELEKLLTMLASNGSEVTESYIRNVILKHYPAARIAEALHNRKRR